MDKPTRAKVADYIDKAIEDSKKEGEEEPAPNGSDGATTNSAGQVRSRRLLLIYSHLTFVAPRNPILLIYTPMTKISIQISNQAEAWICLK